MSYSPGSIQTRISRLLLLALSLQYRIARSYEREQGVSNYNVRIVFVSSLTRTFQKFEWTIPMSLASLMLSLQLPDPRIDLELNIYMQCSSNREPMVAEYRSVTTAKTSHLLTYNTHLENLAKMYRSNGIPTTLLCSSLLYQAHCHAQSTLKDKKRSFIFLLEHDWFMHHSRISHSLFEIVDTMYLNDIHYVRFNKRNNTQVASDSQCLRQYDFHVSFSNKPMPLLFVGSYSNNPHVVRAVPGSQLHMKHHCRKFKSNWKENKENKPGGKWEAHLNRICHACSTRACSKHGCCQTFLYGYAGMQNTVSHMDGRNAWKEGMAPRIVAEMAKMRLMGNKTVEDIAYIFGMH